MCFITKRLKMHDLQKLVLQNWKFWRHQCMDNVLLATIIPPGTRTTLVQEICDPLSEFWKLEVLCDYAGAGSCEGNCLKQSRRALGVHMTVGGGQCCAITHPSALTDAWDLRYGAPLISPARAPREYLYRNPPLATDMGGPNPVEGTYTNTAPTYRGGGKFRQGRISRGKFRR